MSVTTGSNATTPSEVVLSRAEKEAILRKMYYLLHWIELVRVFRYQTMPMDQARKAIQPLIEEFGKEPIQTACEVLVEVFTQGTEQFARLKAHIRRMAFQLIGPEPTSNASAESATAQSPNAAPEAKVKPSERRRPAKLKAPRSTKAPAACAATSERTAASNRSTIMQQYHAAKEKHPGMLLLFRMGDFYELFDNDAEVVSKLLGLTLTSRDRTVSMAGFPHHQLEAYLHKLLKEGQRVAICEPVEESLAKGPIQREVTRVVCPGGMVDEDKAGEGKTSTPVAKVTGKAVRQPRHFVLKEYELRLTTSGVTFVCCDDVRRTTPAVVPHIAGLDYLVLRGDERLIVTVRPNLQAKHLNAIRQLNELFGPGHKSVRVWPSEGPDGWTWHEYPVELSANKPQ